LRLLACTSCHTQYDVTDVIEESFPCRCGEMVENQPLEAVDAKIHRCGSCGAMVAAEASGCTFCGSEIIRDDAKLSLICPECHGRNAEVSRFCGICGVAFSPEAVKLEGFELPCPVCGCLMPPRSVGGLGINECGSCNGIWAPGNRLDELINRAIETQRANGNTGQRRHEPRVTGANPAAQQLTYRKCPECEAFMQRRNFRKTSGVIIDSCHKHGTWLDADELEQITGFVLSGGNPAADAIMAQADRDARKAVAGAEFGRVMGQSVWTRPARKNDSLGEALTGTLFSVLKGFLG
jgi:Zn-finger nucleic acid-binding protein